MLAGWSIVQSVVSRAFVGLRARSDVRNNRGYVIAQYVISNRHPVLNNRKLAGPYKSVRCNRVYVLSESVITKFYCTYKLTNAVWFHQTALSLSDCDCHIILISLYFYSV